MNDSPPAPTSAAARYVAFLAATPLVGFVVPFAVFMAAGTLEPTPDKPFELAGWTIPYSAYPVVYTIKILLTLAAMAAVWPTYRQFPPRMSPLAVVVGVAGVFLWVGLCKLELENTVLTPLGLDWLTRPATAARLTRWSTGPTNRFWPMAFWPFGSLAWLRWCP